MNFFTKHLKEINESYLEHMKCALILSAKMQIGAYAQLIHAIFPFIHPPFGGDVASMQKTLKNIREDKK